MSTIAGALESGQANFRAYATLGKQKELDIARHSLLLD